MADSYCAITDVVSRAQMGAYAAGTTPTTTQVTEFMDSRAAELYSIMAEEVGDDAPGPSGAANYSNTIDTSTDRGFALNQILLAANATGAAMDALEASGVSQDPARSERVVELSQLYMAYFDRIRESAKSYVEAATPDSETHVSHGDITEATVVNRTEGGLAFTGETDW